MTVSPDIFPISELIKLSRKHAVVHAYFVAWEIGMYATFEQMLISLAVALSTKHSRSVGFSNPTQE